MKQHLPQHTWLIALAIFSSFPPLALFAQQNTTQDPAALPAPLKLLASLEVVPNQNSPGATLRLTLTPPKKHKWYYAAPGIGGLPPELEWTLPAGWQLGQVRYPMPERFESFGLINWGYPQAATLEFPLTRTADAQAGQIQVQIDALVCSEDACIPLQAQTQLAQIPLERITPGQVKETPLPELICFWEKDKNRLRIQPPKEWMAYQVLAILPTEDAVDVSISPRQVVYTKPLSWQIPLSKQAGNARPLQAWLLLQDEQGKQIQKFVSLVPPK